MCPDTMFVDFEQYAKHCRDVHIPKIVVIKHKPKDDDVEQMDLEEDPNVVTEKEYENSLQAIVDKAKRRKEASLNVGGATTSNNADGGSGKQEVPIVPASMSMRPDGPNKHNMDDPDGEDEEYDDCCDFGGGEMWDDRECFSEYDLSNLFWS